MCYEKADISLATNMGLKGGTSHGALPGWREAEKRRQARGRGADLLMDFSAQRLASLANPTPGTHPEFYMPGGIGNHEKSYEKRVPNLQIRYLRHENSDENHSEPTGGVSDVSGRTCDVQPTVLATPPDWRAARPPIHGGLIRPQPMAPGTAA
jgi:hypothetical protein